MAVGSESDRVRLSARELKRKLREHFGFRDFRPGQKRAVEAALGGRDTVVIMPTGSGKSLCFQLPALAMEGTTVVVSPLLALIKDQADSLGNRGVPVAAVDSTLNARQHQLAAEAIAAGIAEFVYTTPERLSDPAFRETLKRTPIDLFVVDEAHCVSRWGHDFRPEYLHVGEAIRELNRPPVLALTATATPEVIDDIARQLGLDDPEVVHTGFHRPNLDLTVISVSGEEAKRTEILRLIQEETGTGLIYTATVKAVGELTEYLREHGVSVVPYHGKMKAAERVANQDAFMRGEVRAVLATSAFGMGIDKPDIRFVIHHHVPETLEDYYQEAGRAGRDELPARCTLLYDPSDRRLHSFFQAGKYPGRDDLVNVHHALKRLDETNPKGPLALADLHRISPVGKGRIKQVLHLFRERGIVATADAGRVIRLLDRDATPDDLERVARAFRERDEADRLRHQRMVEYADRKTCRWDFLVNYFGYDDVEGDACGHCDACRRAASSAPTV